MNGLRPAWEGVLAGLLAAAGAAVVATQLADRDILAPSTVLAAADAWLVLAGAPGAFGGDSPPGLALLTLPYNSVRVVVLVPGLLLGAAIVGFVHGTLAHLHVAVATRWAATAALVLNPAWSYVTTTGVATAAGALAVLVGRYGVVRWLRSGSLPWLLAASATFALGTLTWYPTLAWACGALALLGTSLAVTRRPAQEAAGVLIVFVLPLAFTVAGWSVVAWSRTSSAPAWLAGPPADNLIPTSAGILLAALAPLGVALGLGSASLRHPLMVAAGPAVATLFAVGALARAVDAITSIALILLPAMAVLVAAVTWGASRHRSQAIAWLAVCGAILAVDALVVIAMRGDASQPTAQQFARAIAGDGGGGSPPPEVRIGRWLARFSAPEQVMIAALDRRTRNMVAFAAGMPQFAIGGASDTATIRIVDAAEPLPDTRWRPFTADRLAVEASYGE